MTITFGALGAITSTGSSSNVAYPSGVAVGDLLIMVGLPKLGPTSQPSVSGWTSLGYVSHGTVTSGPDVGSMRAHVWVREATSGDVGAGFVSISWGTTPTSGRAFMYRLVKSTGTWDVAFTSAVRTATTTDWSVTYDSDPGVASGDFVSIINAIPTDATSASTAGVLTATGLTAGSATEQNAHQGTTQGDDMSLWFDSFEPTAGTASTAATYTSTLTGGAPNLYGVSVLVRAREVSASDSVSGAIDVPVDLTGSLRTVRNIAGQIDVPVDLTGSLRMGLHIAGAIDVPVDLSGTLSVLAADALAGSIDVPVDLSGTLTVAGGDSIAGSIDVPVDLSGALTVVTPDYLDTTATTSIAFSTFATAELDITPADPPTNAPLITTNIVMPTPVLTSNGRPDPAVFKATSKTVTAWGEFLIIVGGKNMTTVRGIPTVLESWSVVEPFGDATCVLRYPGVTSFEDIGEGASEALAPLAGNPNVTIWRRQADGTVDWTAQPIFQGFVASEDDSIDDGEAGGLVQQCAGALYQANLQQHQPYFGLQSRDIGEVIAAELNGVKGRKFAECIPFFVNIPTRKRGSWSGKLDYVQELLAEAVTPSGAQWTVLLDRGRKPKIGVKDTDTEHYTMTVGTEGLRLSLSRDRTQAENVIYGTGVSSDGQRWANTRYPNLRYDTTPDFPFADLGLALEIGTTDGDTDSGNGVSTWQREAAQIGYDVTETGTFSASDSEQAEELQRRAGLPVTGEVDANTWTATFNLGADVGNLGGAYFAPLAFVSAREPFLYDAAGSVTGLNPDYDPRVVRVERWIDYGEGVTRAEAAKSARAQLSRANNVDFSGTLTLAVDPEEGSRWTIRAGQNIVLKGYRDRPTTLFHIARVEASPQSGTVTLTVDTQARDLLTLASIRKRNKDATDPARALLGRRTSSRTQPDTRPVWDAESGAGRIPPFPKTAASWSVVRIPAGQAGTISSLEMSTGGTRFSAAIFGRPITPADMDRLVGEPLEPGAGGGSKWDENVTALEAEGLLAAFGGPDNAAGYYPGTDPDSGAPGPHTVTGLLVDNGGFEFSSLYPPWLWVAVWTELSAYVAGRMYLSVLDA